MKNRAYISFAVLFALVLNFFTAVPTSAAPLGNLPANMQFDDTKFGNYIKGKLDPNTIGYALTLYKDGKFVGNWTHGYSVLKKDVPSILGEGMSMTPSTRMNIASVTKTITAAAVLRALQQNPSVSLDSKVEPYLPAHWTKGPGVKDLSFKDFMSQYTGMNDTVGGTEIENMREWIKVGVTRQKSAYKYINSNLAIFRIALPYLVSSSAKRTEYNELAKSDQAAFNKAVSEHYVKIVQDTIFKPMGIQNVTMKNDNEMATRFYNKANNAAGYKVGDWTYKGGGGGWVMSGYELATFMSQLRYNDNILAPSTRKLMDDNFLGWQDPAAWGQLKGKYGDYLGHGGTLYYNTSSPETIVGMSSVICNFPSGVQAVLLINSHNGTYVNKEQLMRDAFDQAVVLKQNKKA